jgi:hypothetical protein
MSWGVYMGLETPDQIWPRVTFWFLFLLEEEEKKNKRFLLCVSDGHGTEMFCISLQEKDLIYR